MAAWRVLALTAGLAMLAGAVGAEAPSSSQRPVPRPVATAPAPVVAAATASAPVANVVVAGGLGKSLRPLARPSGSVPSVAPTADMPTAAPVLVSVIVAAAGPATLRPMPRPSGTLAEPQATPDTPQVETASAAPPARPARRGLFGLFGGGNRDDGTRRNDPPTAGYVCGDPDIRGDELARITSRVRGCGIDEPVRVTSISGIRLSTPATIDCATASAFKSWIERGLRPAFRREIVEIRVAASYICRPRNNIRGNKISEHGRGKAVDVSGLVFADGREISVLRDYGREFRRAHKAACGIFGTTLGPGSDGYHEDHLHFDTASHGNGPYCR